MRIGIDIGLDRVELSVDDRKLVNSHRHTPAPALPDPVVAIRQAVETPRDYPALHKALTPDDHVAIAIDDYVARRPELIAPVINEILQARMELAAVSILNPPGSEGDRVKRFLETYPNIGFDVHDPANRKRISYLATTQHGRRVYLNRTIVDADQVVVLARANYDPLLGYGGAEGAIYPIFSDEATRQAMWNRLSMAAPGSKPWPARQETVEVSWLLGTPFLVQLIEGAGNDITYVVGGPASSVPEGQRFLEARWRLEVDEAADTVIAGVSGDQSLLEVSDLAKALSCAARVVKPQGRIILLTQADCSLGRSLDLLTQAADIDEGLVLLEQEKPVDMAVAYQWANAARQAGLYMLSGMPPQTAEDLFTTPLENMKQVVRLLESAETVLVIPDAHKTMAVVKNR